MGIDKRRCRQEMDMLETTNMTDIRQKQSPNILHVIGVGTGVLEEQGEIQRKKQEIQELCKTEREKRKKHSQSIKLSLEKQIASVGVLSVKQVGSSAHLFVLCCNTKCSIHWGRGQDGEQRQECECAGGQAGQHRGAALSHSRDAE